MSPGRSPGPARRRLPAACLLVATLAACSQSAHEAIPAGIGASPELPAPEQTLVPTVNIAKAVGWESHEAPTAAESFQVDAYARNLSHPRWLYVLPNGDVLVAETNAPDRPDDSKGLKGWVAGKVMARAGAAVPSANRITLLRDANGDGRVDLQVTLLEGLASPFGMALVGERLFVANSDAIVAFPYREGDIRIDAPGTTLAALPAAATDLKKPAPPPEARFR